VYREQQVVGDEQCSFREKFSLEELKTAGFTATQLKTAGFTTTEVFNLGVNSTQLFSSGFDISRMEVNDYNQLLDVLTNDNTLHIVLKTQIIINKEILLTNNSNTSKIITTDRNSKILAV
jgi:hypothetical protein